MIKKVISLCICFAACFMLSFFLIYAFIVFRVSGSNAAVITAVCTSVCIAAAMTVLRNIFMLRKEERAAEEKLRSAQLEHLLLMNDDDFFRAFASYFGICDYTVIGNGILAGDNAYYFIRKHGGADAESAVQIIRSMNRHRDKKSFCMIIGSARQEAEDMLCRNGCTLMPQHVLPFAQSAFSQADGSRPIEGLRPFRHLKKLMFSKRFTANCIKYSLLLAAVSVFSFYGTWYLIASCLLFALAAMSVITRKRHHSSTMR